MTKIRYYELCFPDSIIKVRVFKSYNDKTYELNYHGKWDCFQPMSMEGIKAQTHYMISQGIFEIDKDKVQEYIEKIEAYRVMRELVV